MKRTQLLRTILFSFLLITGSSFAQQQNTTPQGSDYIQCTLHHGGPDNNLYEFVPLVPIPSGANNAHLWWSGDNEFTFVPTPHHMHPKKGPGTYTAKMTDVVTENYGNGGPPPLTYTLTTRGGSKTPRTVLPSGESIYMQSYRNAVIDDTMYLIVSYMNTGGQNASGALSFNVGNHAHIVDAMLTTSHRHFLSNNEQWNAADDKCTFQNLPPNIEQSILIPVFVDPNEEDELQMEVNFQYTGQNISSEEVAQGQNYFALNATVAHSHDPNLMLESSEAKNQCDYRNGNIHYTVKFQNVGDGPTKYVRVETFVDDKVDLRGVTASDITFPDFYNGTFQQGTIKSSYVQGAGAIYAIDLAKRKIIFEMHDLPLAGTGDSTVTDLEKTRDQIEFDIKVKSNYVFGEPTKAYSMVFFDEWDPIETNGVETICGDPMSDENGGGFQDTKPTFWDKWKWYILGAIAVVVSFLGFRIFGKKK